MSILRVIHLSALGMILMWAACAPFAWMMRDGLGPDAVTSHGAQAFARFLTTFHWGPLALLFSVIAWMSRKREQ